MTDKKLTSFYRLHTGVSKTFGEKVWVDVQVEMPPKEEEEEKFIQN
jgi:hypothetical protein